MDMSFSYRTRYCSSIVFVVGKISSG